MKYTFFLLLPILLSAEYVTRTHVAMGTFVSVKLNKSNIDHSKNIFKIFKDVENSLSSYDTNSIIYKLNKNKVAVLDKYSYEALNISQNLYKKTNSYFDISIGKITKDYFQFGTNSFIPHDELLAKSRVGFNNVKFDKNIANINENIKIDLGGMGKGYGVDKAVEYLKSKHIDSAVISASGDIRCLNTCKIDINNPISKEALVSFYTKEKEMAVSTSGNYNRYVKVRSKNHLINPKTKKSQNLFVSITLISEISNAMLDGYTTAVSVMPKEEAYKFLGEKDLAYIILDVNNKLTISKNINQFVDHLKY